MSIRITLWNLKKLCEIVQGCKHLEFISLSDHTPSGEDVPGFSPERVVYTLKRAVPSLKEVLILPWPPGPKPVLYRGRYHDVKDHQTEGGIVIEEVEMKKGMSSWR